MRTRKPLSKLIQLTTTLVMLMLSSQSFAECIQGNLTGVWFLNGFSQDPFSGENENFWCKVKFGSSGNVLAGASSCTARVKGQTERVNITGGKLTLNSVCSARGSISLAGGESLTVDSARLDRQKTVLSIVGVGEAPDRFHVVLTGVKQ